MALERIFDYDNVKRRESWLPLDTNSDDFVFDNQVLAQVIALDCAIGEGTCPARYLLEASSINFRRSVCYGPGCLFIALRFRFARWGLARPIAQPPADRLSHNVMPVYPDSPAVDQSPMSWPPDVIGTAHVITSTASIVRSIADLDRDGAWAIARVSGITAPVRATSVIRTGPVSRRSSVITAIIISASACRQSDRKQKEQESRPSRSRFRSSLGGDLRVINNVRFHIMV